jgi:hypothetical protein
MYVVPFLIAFTIPVDDTVAIRLLPDFHVTFLFDAFRGLIVAINLYVLLFLRVSEFLLSLTLLTLITVGFGVGLGVGVGVGVAVKV